MYLAVHGGNMVSLTVEQIVRATGGTLLCGDDQTCITDYSTNSKEGGSETMFVPVVGERIDAHDFIQDAYQHGMRVTFTSRGIMEPQTEGMAYIAVDQNVIALQKLAEWYRGLCIQPIVGVTGSVGKTTTKEMIAAVTEMKYSTLKTEGNRNSQVGLPTMVLRISKEYELVILEMGMSLPGEMARLAKVAKPNMAVITNIGISHIGQLGSVEKIRREKLSIIEAFERDSFLLVNGDDPQLEAVFHMAKGNLAEEAQAEIEMTQAARDKLESARLEAFGTKDFCRYRAEKIQTVGEETHFTYCSQDSLGNPTKEKIILSVLGFHNVLNALAALAVAEQYGISPSLAKQGLKAYQPLSMRGKKEWCAGVLLIDDTYNASPDSVKGALDLLAETKAERKVAVLADILELGEFSEHSHYEVGRLASEKGVSIAVLIGKESLRTVRGILDWKPEIIVHHFMENKEAAAYLKQELRAGDAVLFKGSRGMKIEEIVGEIHDFLYHRNCSYDIKTLR